MDLTAKIDAAIKAKLDTKIDALVEAAVDRVLGTLATPIGHAKPSKRRAGAKPKATPPKRGKAPKAERQASTLTDLDQAILVAVKSGPKSASQLVGATGKTKGGIHGACQRLVAAGQLVAATSGKAILFGLAGAATPPSGG